MTRIEEIKSCFFLPIDINFGHSLDRKQTFQRLPWWVGGGGTLQGLLTSFPPGGGPTSRPGNIGLGKDLKGSFNDLHY